MSPSVSVIVTTYNREDALMAVLRSLMFQTASHFEVIVADDGSRLTTRQCIRTLEERVSFPLTHVWQEDEGFRAAKIRNKAAARAQHDYLVFLDGDCLVRPDFIAQHQTLARSGRFVAGNRILLSPRFTDDILKHDRVVEHASLRQWYRWYREKKCNRWWPLCPLPLGPLRNGLSTRWQGVKTCNLGIWKKDFVAVNGLDEQYEGWGFEDSDLAIRLIRSGIRRRWGHHALSVLHLWHKENDRTQMPDNLQRLQRILESTSVQAERGCDQYLPGSESQGLIT